MHNFNNKYINNIQLKINYFFFNNIQQQITVKLIEWKTNLSKKNISLFKQ